MRIPAVSGQQLQAQGTPGGYLSPGVAPGAFGEGLAQGFGQAAGVAQQIREEVHQIRYTDAMNQVFATDSDLENQAKALKGDDYLKVGPEKFLRDRKNRVQDIVKDLPEPVKVRAMQQADRAGVLLQASLDNHLQTQTEFKKQTNLDAAAQAAQTYAASHPFDVAGNEARLGLALSAADAASVGLTPEAKAQKLDTLHAGVMVAQTQGMLVADPKAAKEFFDKNAEAMSASVHYAGLKATVEAKTEGIDIESKANAVEGTGGTLEDQYRKAAEVYGAEPEKLKLLRQELEHRFNIKQHSQAAVVSQAEGAIWGAVYPVSGAPGISMAQSFKTMPEQWAALGGEGAAKLKAQFEVYARRNENDPGVQVERHLAYYNLINRPDFITLTDNQIRAQQGVLGPALTVQVMADLQALRTNPAKVKEVKIDRDLLLSSAQEFGLVKAGVPENKLPDDQKALLGNLESQLKMLQQVSGKEWNYEQTKQLIKGLSTKVITEKGWFKDTTKPLFEVQISTKIPQAFTDAINAHAEALGQRIPDNAEMYQIWFDSKGDVNKAIGVPKVGPKISALDVQQPVAPAPPAPKPAATVQPQTPTPAPTPGPEGFMSVVGDVIHAFTHNDAEIKKRSEAKKGKK